MRLLDLIEPISKLFGERTRRTWASSTRAHVELRHLGGEELRVLAERLHRAAEERPHVRWLQVNAAARRVIVEFEAEACTVDEIVELIEEAERASQVQEGRFRDEEREHPADVEPAVRQLVELVGNLTAFLVGLGLRVSPLPPSRLGANAATALAVLRVAPKLREGLEARWGMHRSELLLSLANSAAMALAQRPMTTLVDGLQNLALLREAQASRRTWQRREPALCAEPAGDLGLQGVEARPCELPRGPIEEYVDRAWFVSLAGFAVSFATTRSFQRAVAALFGGLPRPANLGRDVFCAQLGRVCSDRDVLVMEPAVLRRLDRIDCIVLQGDLITSDRFVVGDLVVEKPLDAVEVRQQVERLFDRDSPLEVRADGGWELGPWRLLDARIDGALADRARELARAGGLVLGLARDGKAVAVVEVEVIAQTGVDELIAAAHDAQMRVVVASGDESILQAVHADDVIPAGEGLEAGIRRLQRAGRAVCMVGTGLCPGLPISDCGIGLVREGEPAPWGAHLIVGKDLDDVRFVIEACVQARTVSKQAVNIALGAATLGALVSAGGLLPLTTRRVLFVVNAASLVAMANGTRFSSALERRALPPRRDPTPWHALDADGVLERLESSRQGISRQEAEERGPPERAAPSPLRELGEAVTDELFNPLAPLLAAGAGLSAVVGSLADATMVGGVVGLNAVVGGVQRFRTERKIRELASGERQRALVRREGKAIEVDAAELVPGDLVLLSSGDVVPADCRLLEASSLEVDASSLTGESLPVRKAAAPSFEAQIADRASMLYAGTAIAAGHATAVVVAVGDATEARRGVAAKASRVQGGVEKRLRSLMGLTAPIALVAGVGVIGGGLLRGRRLEDLVGSGVSLAVASVPEGLPLLATAAQLSAAERLSRRHAYVRNARSIEALGRVDVICVDKTGTVTQGRIALSRVSDGEAEEEAMGLTGERLRVLAAGLRATVTPQHTSQGDPTDEALRAGAAAAALSPDYGCAGWRRDSVLSFETGRSYHAVLGRSDGGLLLSVKGAPEAILLQCTSWDRGGERQPLGDAGRLRLIAQASRLAHRGLRLLAVAERPLPEGTSLSPEQLTDLSFRGFLAFSDPVRPTATAAVEGLRRAGIRTVMITGDHPNTAEAIAAELGLLRDGRIVTGAELARLSDDELDAGVQGATVFARVTPSQKVRVVRALQRAGRVVAMVGDGANDAPAIRLADVGIAVGEQSTAAARGAADLVLTDGRIETLVDAIVEGRAMWASVRDAVSILMGGNLGEIGFTLGAGLLDGRPPLNARQLLLVNLLTDVAPAMAIALRPPSPMTFEALASESPDKALGEPLNRDIVSRALVTATGAGGAWLVGRLTGTRARARTIGLAALVGTQLGQTLTSGGFSRPVVLTSLASAGALAAVIQTPGISHFFGCRPLGPIGWTTAIGASAAATTLSTVISRVAVPAWNTAAVPSEQALTAMRRWSGLLLDWEE